MVPLGVKGREQIAEFLIDPKFGFFFTRDGY